MLRNMIDAGMNVARIGLAHGTLEDALIKFDNVRAAAKEKGVPIGILADLPGPKVRAGSFPDGGVELEDGSTIRMVPGNDESSAEVVQVDYETLLEDVHVGDRLAFGDGAIDVIVESCDGDSLKVHVAHGGLVQGRPGVHIPSDRLRMTAPTEEDLRLLDAFVEVDVDMVALSFVRSAHDIRRVGTEPFPRGPMIMAKIETRAAVENLDGIIEASGAVMVARGDLGSEFPLEELPHLQKEIIKKCIALGRPAVTATQMLESMITAPSPTRAEACDVANAVFDGSSAIMLSGESAVGRDPANAVATMARIAARADQEFDYEGWAHDIARVRLAASADPGEQITDAMTMAAWRAASHVGVKAILCLSRTGFTVRSIARFRPTAKLMAFSPSTSAVNQLSLSWGAMPIFLGEANNTEEMVASALILARESGEVDTGDLVAVLAGTSLKSRATNTLRILRIP